MPCLGKLLPVTSRQAECGSDSDSDSTHGSRERPGREADGEVGVRGSGVLAEPSLQRLVAEPVKRCQHKREVTTQQLLEELEVCLAVAHQRRARP